MQACLVATPLPWPPGPDQDGGSWPWSGTRGNEGSVGSAPSLSLARRQAVLAVPGRRGPVHRFSGVQSLLHIPELFGLTEEEPVQVSV